MQALICGVENLEFAISLQLVHKVIPPVKLKPILNAPISVAGSFLYQGKSIPVIDLSGLLYNKATKIKLSSRILLYKYDLEGNLVGVLSQSVVETLSFEQHELKAEGYYDAANRYLGKILIRGNRTIGYIELKEILTPELKSSLFTVTE